MMYAVVWEVIYTIIDNYSCLDYLGFPGKTLYKEENNFENT